MSKIIQTTQVPQNFISAPIKEDHFVLGDGQLSVEVLMPTGHGWGPFLPLDEVQSRGGLETQCCTAYGTHNCIEAIGKLKFGSSFQNNLSERYLSTMAGMNGNGGMPHQVAETLRNDSGAIPEVFLPFDSSVKTLKQYFSPNPMSYSLFKIGRHWLSKYTMGHEWVFLNEMLPEEKIRRMKDALRFSPLGVAGWAWSLGDDGKYYTMGPAIHWFEVFDYVEGEYWLAFDSYAPFIKKLDWNYTFEQCKRYSLKRNYIAGEAWTDPAPDEPKQAVIPYLIYLAKYYLGIK